MFESLTFSETVNVYEPDVPHPLEHLSVTFAPDTVDTDQEITAFKLDMMSANAETTTGSAVHDLITKTKTSIFTSGLPKEFDLPCKRNTLFQKIYRWLELLRSI